MIELMIQNLKGGLSETKLPGTVIHHFIVALISGFIGFSSFFITLIFIKLFNNLTGHFNIFTIDYSDILLSSIGFLCLFIISFLETLQVKNK